MISEDFIISYIMHLHRYYYNTNIIYDFTSNFVIKLLTILRSCL